MGLTLHNLSHLLNKKSHSTLCCMLFHDIKVYFLLTSVVMSYLRHDLWNENLKRASLKSFVNFWPTI